MVQEQEDKELPFLLLPGEILERDAMQRMPAIQKLSKMGAKAMTITSFFLGRGGGRYSPLPGFIFTYEKCPSLGSLTTYCNYPQQSE